jgi:hypothetical protein
VARTRTLADLRADIEARADLGELTADTFIKLDTMNRWIAQSARRLASLMINALGEDYFVATQSISVVAGTAEYDLPSDYYQTRYVRARVGSGVCRIEKSTIDDLGMDSDANQGWQSRRPSYRVMQGQMVFSPTPTEAATVTHVYVPTLIALDDSGDPVEDLTEEDDAIDGHNGWEEWIVLDCCIKAANAQEQDPSAWMAEKAEIEADIRQSAQMRSGEPDRVRDVYLRSGMEEA